MKKYIAIALVMAIIINCAACGAGSDSSKEVKEPITEALEVVKETTQIETIETDAELETETETETVETEEVIEDEGWDELEAIGNIQTENGILTATITFPKDFVGEDVTQDSLDEKAGDTYISAKLNEDGSVSYKMTKKQHKAMMEDMEQSMEKSLQNMLDEEDYSFTQIEHNKDYTEFDVTCSGNELTLYDSIATLGLYMYSGMYGIFSGVKPEHVIVNFYNPDGELISTADSDDLGD